MKRSVVRRFLWLALLLCLGFAAWSWLRPYDWRPDPLACCRVVVAQVTQDRSYYWLDLRLKMRTGESHDLMKPVRLLTTGGRDLEPADTTLGGNPEQGTTDLWFKFWLEPQDLEGPLYLSINDGKLKIRARSGVPRLDRSSVATFPTSNW